jgi:hypothetical protein
MKKVTAGRRNFIWLVPEWNVNKFPSKKSRQILLSARAREEGQQKSTYCGRFLLVFVGIENEQIVT